MLKIRTYPEPVLTKPAQPVTRIDRKLLRLAAQMFETMYEDKGVGLAAPQVGESVRMCVLNTAGKSDGELVLINPVIVEASSDEVTAEEGCLSVPGIRSNVARSARIKVHAYDLTGKEVEIEAEGLDARCLQHEIDHLNGRLFFQRLNEAARMVINSRIKALEEKYKKG